MKVTINVKLLNADFIQSIADEFYEGKESEENVKYIWEDEFIVEGDVATFKIVNNTEYTLAGYLANDEAFSYTIPSMMLVECIDNSGKMSRFAFSKKLIKSTDKVINKDGDITFSVILKDEIDYKNPMDGVYIITKDFPKELLKA
jgi:hypothetical protein